MAAGAHKLYAVTIFGYKKDGMGDDEYHEYISKTHAGHLKHLLAQNDIVYYTMQHNAPAAQAVVRKAYPAGQAPPPSSTSDCDAVVQIVFRNTEDYLRVRQDPHFIQVVGPDHSNFADSEKTRFAYGWFEVHVTDGKVVSD